MKKELRLYEPGSRLRELADQLRQRQSDARFVGAMSFGNPSSAFEVARLLREVSRLASDAAEIAESEGLSMQVGD